MEKKKTSRGFGIISFKDGSNVECSLQKSSRADKDMIWFGCDKVGMKEFIAFEGWKDRPEFDEFKHEHHFVANTRMHLTRAQVKKLLPHLQKFVETGNF